MNKITDLFNVFLKPKPADPSPLKSVDEIQKPVEHPQCPTKDQLIELFEEWAFSFAGKSEVGGNTNRADYIDDFNACVGQPMGQPYCLSAYQFRRREIESKYNIIFDLPFCAGTQYFWSQCKSIYRKTEPARGRFALFRSAIDPTKGHFALCTSEILEGGQFNTFEFNTSGNGSRNGMWQMRKTRKMGANGSLILLGFVDFTESVKTK